MRKSQHTKLNACMIVNQLDEKYFDWSDEELQALHASCNSGDHSSYTAVIVERLRNAGIEVDAAYTICHDKDSVSRRNVESPEIMVKPRHNHTVLKFGQNRGGNISQIAKAIGISRESVEKPKQGRYAYDDMLAYLVHIKYVDKHQYDPAEVFTFCGRDYQEIYSAQKESWLEGRASIKCKQAEVGIDHLEEEILQGRLSRQCVLLTDELFDVYSRNKRRCEDAFDTFAQRKIYRTLQALEDGEFLLTVYFLRGKSRVGKSRFAKDLIIETQRQAKEKFGVDWSVYSCAATNPLDNFLGEEIILMDDLRGASMRYEDWLKLLDPENSSYASARYRNIIPACRVVIITASIEPTEFFYYCKGLHSEGRSEAMDQFIARIMRSVHIIPVDQFGNRVVEISQSRDIGLHRVDIKSGEMIKPGDYFSPEETIMMNFDFTDEIELPREDAIEFLAEEIIKRNDLKNKRIVGTLEESEETENEKN